MKLIHALRGDDLGRLLDPGLRAALTGVGARRLQVNLDVCVDDAVGDDGALRLQHVAEPIRAVVSTWTDGHADEVSDVLRQVAGQDGWLAGWRVEERVPIEPPQTADGERADTLANIAFLRRPDDMPFDAWIGHWHGPHTDIAIRTQGTFGYVQNVVVESLTPETPRVDGIVEELFPSAAMQDIHAFYGSGGDQAELDRRMTELMASVTAFGADRDLDLVPTSRYVFDLS